jgi:hypothetical protein
MPDDSGVTLEYSSGQERLRLEAWGDDSIRVRVGQAQIAEELPGALVAPRLAPSAGASRTGTTLVNGRLRAQISADGLVSFSRSDNGSELLSEQKAHFWWPGPRLFLANGKGHYRASNSASKHTKKKGSTASASTCTALRPKGPRHGPGAAKCRGFGTFYGLEQRLRFPLELPRCGPCRACRQRDSLGGGQRGANRLLGERGRQAGRDPFELRRCHRACTGASVLGERFLAEQASLLDPGRAAGRSQGVPPKGGYRWR